MSARLRGICGSLAAILVALLLVRSFVAEVWRVDSGSMLPILHGGEGLSEHVLVKYGAGDLERFDLVVLRQEEGGDPIVKRVVGLPGETIRIIGGDLIVNGQRLPPANPRPAPVPVFDDTLLLLEDHFHMNPRAARPWRYRDGEWHLDARGVPPRSDGAMALLHLDLRDAHFDHNGEFVPGVLQMNDGSLACSFLLEESTGFLRFRLLEEGDVFRLTVRPLKDDRALVRLLRRNPRTLASKDPLLKEELLLEREIPLTIGEWHGLRFSNTDNHLVAQVAGVRLEMGYDQNEPYPGRTGRGDRSVGSRVGLGGEGCLARFRDVRVLRDLYWSGAGEHAVSGGLSLGPGEFFVLGDNSRDSRDSRTFGPVRLSNVIGRPVAVVWPPSSWRWLAPTAD